MKNLVPRSMAFAITASMTLVWLASAAYGLPWIALAGMIAVATSLIGTAYVLEHAEASRPRVATVLGRSEAAQPGRPIVWPDTSYRHWRDDGGR